MRYGYFDKNHDEYVIERVDLPTSWTNYLGVEKTVAVVNQTAGGYLFHESPEYHRITRFRANAVPLDRPGDYVYLRDQETGDYWSISWQPVGKSLDKAHYMCRHGFSYSVYTCDYDHIQASEKLSVPIGDDALVWDVVVKNNDKRTRKLDVFTYAEFSFHQIPIDNQNFQMSLYCAGSHYENGVILYDLFYEENGYQYFTSNTEPDGHDCLRDAFIGTWHSETDPQAVVNGKCSGSEELGGNHCASLQKHVELKPGESARLIYFLGEGRMEQAEAVRRKYADPSVLDQAYEALHAFWKEKQSCLHIETPDEGMNIMLNSWNLYQAEINVMFSRFASFIEVGGRTGLGYRDTAQDAMTVIHSDPDGCRKRIVQLLEALTAGGYGIHLFEPRWFEPKDPDEKKPFVSPTVIPEVEGKSKVHGLKDACSDDALWLVPTIVEYVKETGDIGFLARKITYCDGGEGSVYEHMQKIIHFSSTQTGSHGIPLGLRADWNDCLNLGGGESALTAYLLYEALQKMIETADCLGKKDDAEEYRKLSGQLKEAYEKVLWDGKWYLRGFTKNGRKIGTHTDAEGKVHLESNAWAVLSTCAEGEHAEKALSALHDHLSTPYGIRLNAPAYTVADDDIGFVTRVYPGLKENSSIFSHSNPWVWAAETKLGHGNRAMEYYHALTPYYQNDAIEVRSCEPYSYCQFVSGPDHTTYGRAHHPFMTGSGGWAYYSASHYMLGIRPGFAELIVDPCIPSEWDGFEAVRVFRGCTYRIHVQNPQHIEKGSVEILVDGEHREHIPVFEKGSVHDVTVIMKKEA